MIGVFVRLKNKVTGHTKMKYIHSLDDLKPLTKEGWYVIDPPLEIIKAKLNPVQKEKEEKEQRIREESKQPSPSKPKPEEIAITSEEEARKAYKILKERGYDFGRLCTVYPSHSKNYYDRLYCALQHYWGQKAVKQAKRAYEEFKNEPGYEDVYKKQMERLKILYGDIVDTDSERETAKKIAKSEDKDSKVKQDPGDSTPDVLKKGKKVIDTTKEELTDVFEETDKKDKMILGFGIVLLAAGILLMKR